MKLYEKKFSVILPTRNEARNIERCLDSIAKQDYPHEAIEILVADAESEDGTLRLIADWRSQNEDIALTVLPNPRKVAEFGKALAIRRAQGEFICMLDADNEIVQRDWMKTVDAAFTLYPEILGFESHYLEIPGWSSLSNFLTSRLHIDDPLAYAIATSPVEMTRKEQEGKIFRKFLIRPGYPCGANGFVFRAEFVHAYKTRETFEEGQVALDLERQGDAYICQVDGYGIYHYYCQGVRQFLAKKKKRAVKHATRGLEHTTSWVSFTGARRYGAVLLHGTLIVPLVQSIWKAVARRDPLWLWWGPSAFLTTLVYVLNWGIARLTGKKAW